MSRHSKSKLAQSFINITDACLKKSKRQFNFKEKGLVSMAEKVIMLGIGEDDEKMTENISEYFIKLRRAYSNEYRFYMGPEYILCFDRPNLLIDVQPIHGITRNDSQVLFKANKQSFEEMSPADQYQYRVLAVNEFKFDTGNLYDDEIGFWRNEM